MDTKIYESYIAILKSELVPALGCTEPIAIAYGAAEARNLLGRAPERILVDCSGSIIKNAHSVIVPNSGGMKGVQVAAALGALAGDSQKKLQVLDDVGAQALAATREFLAQGRCSYDLAQNVEELYIAVTVWAGEEYARVVISGEHTNIVEKSKNGKVLLKKRKEAADAEQRSWNSVPDKTLLNVEDIITFARTVELERIQEILQRQIDYNTAIAEEGLGGDYGVNVGRELLCAYGGQDVRIRARARAAAGSDARMNGCPLPVVINAGSGNQGMTVSLPVVEYARCYQKSQEELLRALALANLIALLQKRYIGNLSAFCGAVSAAAGAASGILFLLGGGYQEISDTITYTICTVGGMVCDGAKSSCAAKIATALETAFTGMEISRKNRRFRGGDGLVKENVEETIASVGRMGKQGMRETNIAILNIMME